MPLRSVEAATRDDAIAAAREQFGPSARVVGVRRVRSGGVLGFFATERYVAEVAPDLTSRPAVPAVTPPAGDDDAPADFSSPLGSAAPARARATAPARNGAAAWAAEAARTAEAPASSSFPSSARSAAPARPLHPAAGAPAKRPADDDRVSELASLLAARQAETDTPTYARPTFPRATVARTGSDDAVGGRDADKRVLRDDVPDTPSPFTAALARMVAGDRDVRQAVEEALVRPGARPSADAEPRPAAPARIAESAVPPSPARQEEETMGNQVIAPSSSTTSTVEVPTWAAEREVAAPAGSSREEAIAEVLRSALAQGHSDEALAGILRKVLAGASPQSALTTPVDSAPAPQQHDRADDVPASVVPEAADLVLVAPVTAESAPPEPVVEEPTAEAVADVPETTAPEVVVAEPAAQPVLETSGYEDPADEDPADEDSAYDVPVVEEPAFEAPVYEAPVYEAPVYEAPVYEAPAFEAPVFDEPVFEAPVFESPVFHVPAHEVPADGAPMFEVPVYESRPDARPVEPFGTFSPATPSWTPAPTWVASPTSMWDPPSMSATLWGEPVRPAGLASTPIWAEVSAPVSAEPIDAALFQERTTVPAAEVAEVRPVEPFAAVDESLVDEPLVKETLAEEPSVEEPVAEVAVLEETVVADATQETVEELVEESVDAFVEEVEQELARTASDPAPMMSFDSTSIMPPLSLLPPLPGSRGRGRPPVPPAPSRRSSASSSLPVATPPVERPEESAATPASSSDDVWAALVAPLQPSLATVTRLPVAPMPEAAEADQPFEPEVVEAAVVDEAPAGVASPAVATGEIADRLVELGVPRSLLGATFADDVRERGTYAALTRALALRLPKAPELPNGAGEVLFVVGPGVETLRVAQSLAASLRLDPDRVQWATRGDLAGLAPESSRVTTVAAAISRRDDAAVAGTLTIVAVDAPLRADAYWPAQMMAAWTPVAVWAVVEATRKPEDLEPWIDALPRVDALIVQDTDLSNDPAAVLRRVDMPVALVDGARATPHRWASLLCERLETPQA